MADSKNSPVVRLYPTEWRLPIPASELQDAIQTRDLNLEYRLLRYLTETPAMAASMERPDPTRDRYSDRRCYAHNKVTLPNHVEQLPSFYINASFVSSHSDEKGYIATQAPLPHTIEDFFRMITAYNVKSIFCLAGEQECKSGRCHPYWPTNPGESSSFGSVTVTLASQEVVGSFIRRNLSVTMNKTVSEIHHVQFLGWPDHGVPDISHTTALIGELDLLRSISTTVGVHCSAGVGRTGCLIAIANAIDAARATGKLSVLEIVLSLRQQRPFMVETTGQYELIYKATAKLLEYSFLIFIFSACPCCRVGGRVACQRRGGRSFVKICWKSQD